MTSSHTLPSGRRRATAFRGAARSAVAVVAVLALAMAGCDAEASPGSSVAAGSAATAASAPGEVETIPAETAADGVEAMDGDFTCAPPVRRADDHAWICEGSRAPVTATIHLYATEVDGPIFGATLYTSAPSTQDAEGAATATEALALHLIRVTVPEAWRDAASSWIGDRMPDGGRTLDVPGAGITASVQPLTALQWYVELYELDGLKG